MSDDEEDLDLEAVKTPAVRRKPSAKMRRAFDDLDVAVYAAKRARRHRRQRFVRTLRKLAGLCASCGGKLAPTDKITCARCLDVDKAYKTGARETEATARYVDEFGRPMKLRFTPRMLPVVGIRYDGDDPRWPACSNLSECMTELVRSCGAKDAPGASCPKGCPLFKAELSESA